MTYLRFEISSCVEGSENNEVVRVGLKGRGGREERKGVSG